MTALSPEISIRIQNDSGERIPPFSAVVVTSVEFVEATDDNEAYIVHHVEKYIGQDGNIFVTGNVSIGFSSGYDQGLAYSDQFIYVSIDDGAGDPTPGEEWGPVSGEWFIGPTGSGFLAQGHAETEADPKRSMFYRAPTTTTTDTTSCRCCECFHCISEADAIVAGCLAAPNGAAYQYTSNFNGSFSFYSAIYGFVVFTNAVAANGLGGTGACKWFTNPVLLTQDIGSSSSSSAATGSYQWVVDMNVASPTIKLTFVSGTNFLGL